MTLRTISNLGDDIPHSTRWELREPAGESPEFELRCLTCNMGISRLSFTWLGGDGPTLGKVLSELSRNQDKWLAKHMSVVSTTSGSAATQETP